MEITNKDNRIKELENENAILKEQLNKYLMKNKVYYENNKEEHKQRVKVYREKTNYNHKPPYIDTLYLEPHIQKEAEQYIKTIMIDKIESVSSTIEGCRKIVENKDYNCATIASSKNECNLYYTLDRDIVKHNITTFSLI